MGEGHGCRCEAIPALLRLPELRDVGGVLALLPVPGEPLIEFLQAFMEDDATIEGHTNARVPLGGGTRALDHGEAVLQALAEGINGEGVSQAEVPSSALRVRTRDTWRRQGTTQGNTPDIRLRPQT